jgi:LacI family transcriptional regulator
VSSAVVSRVFNGDPTLHLREETRAAVLRAIKTLRYTPHSAAQGLRKARTRTIGLVLDQVTSPMLTDLVAGAQRAALRADHVLIMIDAEEVEEGRALVRHMIAANRIDGLLLHPLVAAVRSAVVTPRQAPLLRCLGKMENLTQVFQVS